MKKFIVASILSVTVLTASWLLSGPYNSQSFINGRAISVEQPASATALIINGNTTATSYTNDLGQLVTAGTNASGVYYGPFGRYVTVRANGLGDASANSISVKIPDSSTTNTVTLVFERSADGSNFDTGTTWSIVVPGSGNTASPGPTLVTNVPTWLVTGASQLRVANITFATNSFGWTNGLASIRLNNFAP